jgi:hypothetical protein
MMEQSAIAKAAELVLLFSFGILNQERAWHF